MRYNGEARFEGVRQAATLALSGFLLMSSLAALGSGHSHAPTPKVLEELSFQDSSAHLVRSDQSPAAG